MNFQRDFQEGFQFDLLIEKPYHQTQRKSPRASLRALQNQHKKKIWFILEICEPHHKDSVYLT